MKNTTPKLFQIIVKNGIDYICPAVNEGLFIQAASHTKAIEATINHELGWLMRTNERWLFVVKETGRVRSISLMDRHYVYIEDTQNKLYSFHTCP